jgi:prostaglandin-H2 D-isomerase / glutathione transferase
VIEVDGETLTQSNTMLRYAGKLAKLYPEDPFEAAKVDEFIDIIEDILPKFYQAVFETDQEKRKILLQHVNEYFQFLIFFKPFFFYQN